MNRRPYLYGAYGSNLNRRHMAQRCPDAKPLGSIEVPDMKLVFRDVADIEPAKGRTVPLGLWSITQRDEDKLDRYEGYPFLYGKQMLYLPKVGEVLVYTMSEGSRTQRNGLHISPPNLGYLDSIAQGFEDFDLDTTPLIDALDEAYLNETVQRNHLTVVE